MEKKAYSTPRLTEYGDARKITKSASSQNRDTPSGADNTAFPNSP
jgi:hypothetical protein